MHWIAPSEEDTATDTNISSLSASQGERGGVRCCPTNLAALAVPAPSSRLNSQEYSGGRPHNDGRPQGFGLIFLCLAGLLTASTAHAADTLSRRQWTVDDVVREALVYAPPQARTNAAPVVFAFHGHGGSMLNAARTFGYPSKLGTPVVTFIHPGPHQFPTAAPDIIVKFFKQHSQP